MAIITGTGTQWPAPTTPTGLRLPAPNPGPAGLAIWRAPRLRGLARSKQCNALKSLGDAWTNRLTGADRDFWIALAATGARPLRRNASAFTTGWTMFVAYNEHRILGGLKIENKPAWGASDDAIKLKFKTVNRETLTLTWSWFFEVQPPQETNQKLTLTLARPGYLLERDQLSHTSHIGTFTKPDDYPGLNNPDPTRTLQLPWWTIFCTRLFIFSRQSGSNSLVDPPAYSVPNDPRMTELLFEN